MKLNTSFKHYGYFLLYAALLTLPALAVDIGAFSTFEPIKVLTTISLGVLLGWWGVIWWGVKDTIKEKNKISELASPPSRLVSICFYGYWISILIATITSVAPLVSIFGLAPRYQGLLLYIAVFMAGMGISTLNRRQIEKVLSIAIIGGVIVSTLGILQGLIPSLTQWWDIDSFLGRTFSTMGHPSYLADYLLLVIPLFYWKWTTSRRWLTWSLLGIIVGVAFLLTLSRGAFLGLATSILFFMGVYGYWHKRRGLLIGAIITPLLLAMLVVGVNVMPSGFRVGQMPLLNRLMVHEENLRSVSTRFVLWPSVVKHISQRPLFGFGPDTFALSFATSAPKEILKSENFNAYADRAHNFFLDSMVNIGVVGTGFLLLLLWLTIRVVIRSGDPLLLALGSALIGHIISQQFEFSLTVHLIFFWVYMGMIWRFNFRETTLGMKLSSLRFVKFSSRIIVTLLVLALFMGYIIPTFLADRLAREGDFTKAITIAPHRSEYILSEAKNLIEKRGDRKHIISLLHAVKLFSGDLDYRPYFYEGVMLRAASEYPKSFLSFEEAIKRAPIFPPLYKAYGKALLDSGDNRAAIAQFTKYLDLAPPYWKMKGSNKKWVRDPPRDASAEVPTPTVSGELTGWNKQQYQVFYKLNPEFDEIFELIQKASIAK